MHNKPLRAEEAEAHPSNTSATDLRAYLDRLIDNLDDSSLHAVLKLMVCEARSAVCKQQQLIALERVCGREAGGRMERLRELRAAQKQLAAVFASYAVSEDEGAAPVSPVDEPVQNALPATESRVYAFKRAVPGTIGKEQGVYVGRISAAAPDGELGRSEPAPVRHRQGRHGAGPAR